MIYDHSQASQITTVKNQAAADPTSSSSTSGTINGGVSRLADNEQTFLKLLTVQLKNQDPMSPMDTNAFTAQITQMTGVEQQIVSNKLLTQLLSQNQSGLAYSALSMIGKNVTAAGTDRPLTNGQATWKINLASNASAATVQVVDSAGKVVWSGKPTSTTAGMQSFTWNGKDNNGAQLPDGGTYTLKVAAADAKGKAITASTYIMGVVDGIQQVNGQTVLTLGKQQVSFNSVIGVTNT